MRTPEEWVYDYFVRHTVQDETEPDGAKVVAPREQWIRAIQEDATQELRAEVEVLKRENSELKSKNLAWATGVEQSNTDIVDMQRDEFRRIISLLKTNESSLSAEITGICERAIACIEQTVPVVVQRDNLERERDRLRAEVEALKRDKERFGLIQQELLKRAEDWRNAPIDPYNIANAVQVALNEVASSINAAMKEGK